jgi:hypothetical protein
MHLQVWLDEDAHLTVIVTLAFSITNYIHLHL